MKSPTHESVVASQFGSRAEAYLASAVHAGFAHTLHRHDYGDGVDYGRFWGGGEANSNWMEKDEILRALAHFGFGRQIVELEENPNGAALRVAATRDSGA